MAQIRETTVWNLPHSIERAFAKPLDSKEVWYPTWDKDSKSKTLAKERALAYARSGFTTSYVGQVLCVVEGHVNLETGEINYKGVQPKYYSVYINSSGDGDLYPMIPEDGTYQYENREIDYKNGLIGDLIILGSGEYFKRGSSTLFINGIQYNQSEYEEGLYEGGSFAPNSSRVYDDISYVNAIRFTKFELNPGDNSQRYGNYDKGNNGDEILISAIFYEPSNQ